MSMTPEQKLKHAVLIQVAQLSDKTITDIITEENIDDLYQDCYDCAETEDYLQDAVNEMREDGIETDLPSESSRHYEAKEVARKMLDGSWVGWTYWYGGGKHGEPAAIDWMDSAYDLDCKEEEKMVVVRTFSKVTS